MTGVYVSEAAAIEQAERHGWTVCADQFGHTATRPDGTVARLLTTAPAFRKHLRYQWVQDEETGA